MSDDPPIIQMYGEVKSKLIEVLIECKKINNELEEEFKRLEHRKRFGKCEMLVLVIARDEWTKLVDMNKKQIEVLEEITTTYRALFDLNSGWEMRIEEIECKDTVTKYDYKKYDDLKDSLLNLLETSRTMYKSLKEKFDLLSVRRHYDEIQQEACSARQAVTPETIEELTHDIAVQFDLILKNCKDLWGVQDKNSGEHDSGYRSGNRISQEEDIAESLDILLINNSDGDLLTYMGQAANRRRSAEEHEEIGEQTHVKEI